MCKGTHVRAAAHMYTSVSAIVQEPSLVLSIEHKKAQYSTAILAILIPNQTCGGGLVVWYFPIIIPLQVVQLCSTQDFCTKDIKKT